MQHIIDVLPNLEPISTLIVGIITGSITLFIFYRKNAGGYEKEYYENLIFPIFLKIEYKCYNKIDKDVEKTISEISDIMGNNRHLLCGSLMDFYCEISNNRLTQNTYNFLCNSILSEYDRCCANLGLRKRTISYICTNKQYLGNSSLIILILKKTFLSVIKTFILLFFTFISILMIIAQITKLLCI